MPRSIRSGLSLLWLLLLLSAGHAAPAPIPCAFLHALHESTGAGPKVETRPDTDRLQAALDRCALGGVVYLVEDRATGFDAFITAPLRVPAGVTLSVAAGITVYGSRELDDYLPPSPASSPGLRPLLQVTATPGGAPGGIAGHGVIDGRGDLLFGPQAPLRWRQLQAALRPALVTTDPSSYGMVRLTGITLRNAPGTAIHLGQRVELASEGIHIVSAPELAGTRGIAVQDETATLRLAASTVAGEGPALQAAKANLASLPTDGLAILEGRSVQGEPDGPCLLRSDGLQLHCTPAAELPTTAATLAFETQPEDALRLCATLQPVVFAASVRPRTIRLLQAGTALAVAETTTHGSQQVACFALTKDASSSDLSAEIVDTGQRFGLTAEVDRTSSRSDPGSVTPSAPTAPLSLTVAPAETAQGKPLLLTAQLAPDASGTIDFLDGEALLQTEEVAPGGGAAFGTASLTPGLHLLSARYHGDPSHPAQASAPVAATITPADSSFQLQAYPATALAGEPIAVDAIGLPADATGYLDYRDNGLLIATVRLSGTRISHYESFGDSITAGAGATTPALAYPALLGGVQGLPLANHARNGSIACEMLSDGILPHGAGATQSDLPLFSLMVGTNDADNFFHVPAQDDIYRNCHRAALSWLGVAREHKILAGDAGAQPADNTWTLDAGSADAGLHTLFHGSGSGTARFTLTTAGLPAYLWYLQNDLLPGTFTLSIDGAPTGTVYQTQPARYQPIVNHVAFAFDRLPLPAGTHVFEVQALSGGVGILGFGTPATPGAGEVRPTVLVGDVPHQRTTTALLSEADLDHYTYLIQTGLALLGQDGLDLRFVRTRDDLLGLPAEMTDSLHPNDRGEQELAQAFARVFPTPAGALAASVTLHPGAGDHQIQATYSGDSHYAGFTAPSVNVTLGDARTSTSLSVSSTEPAFQTPVTLTATVVSTAAGLSPLTGSVTFLDAAQTVLGSAPLTSGGASLQVTLPFGAHTLTAVYSSDLWRPGSTSSPIGVTVVPRDEPTQIHLSASAQAGQTGTSAALSATVTAPSPLVPDGMVVFLDSGTAVGESAVGPDGAARIMTANLSDGMHSFEAVYQGNSGFVPSSSGASTLQVRFAATQLTLTSSTTHYPARQPVTVLASVVPASATGTITLFDGATVLSTLPLSNGTATYTSASLPVGTHNLRATYSGDTYDAGAQGPTLAIAVEQVTTSLALSGLPAQAPYGTAGTLLATVAPADATGTVTFTDTSSGQTTLLAAPTLVAGQASLPLDKLSVGTHNLQAAYGGDPSDLPAAAAVAITINSLPTQTTLTSSATTFELGASITLTATVSPATLQGQVSLRDQSGAELQRLTPINGIVSWSSSTWGLGAHRITASYVGDEVYQVSTSPSVGLQVNRRHATVALAALPATLTVGTPASLAAQISPADATGTVTFLLADGTALGQSVVDHGKASVALPRLAAGSYRIGATYSGDVDDEPANADLIATQITLNPTTLSLSGLPTTMPFSTPVTLTASISPAAASGVVTFVDAAAGPLGSAPLLSGVATLAIRDLPVGSHTVTASYAEDPTYAGATTAAATQVTPDTSVTELRLAQANVPAGTPVFFNIRVQTASSDVPTGMVAVRSGSRVLAQGMLGNGAPGVAYVTLSTASAALGLGSYPVVAFYSGDSANTLSNSSASPQAFTVVATPVQATFALSRTQVAVGSAVQASVALSAASGVPVGAVLFATQGQGAVTVPVDSAGRATATLPALAVGSYAVTAQFLPGGLFAAANMAPAGLTVTNPVAVAFSATSLTMTAGSAQDTQLTITPLSGFTGAVQATCGASAGFLHCTVEGPGSVGGATSQARVHLVVDKDLLTVSQLSLPRLGPLLCVLLLPCLAGRRKEARMLWIGLLTLAISTLGLGGCATGGDFFSIPSGPQKIEVTVRAAGVDQSATLAIQVNR